jgi:thiamine biosynthesis lipoprotein
MHWNCKYPVVALLLMLVTACHAPKPAVETKDRVMAFGTFVEVTLIDVPPQSKKAILKRLNDQLNYMHYAFHAWKAGPIGRTNQLLAAAGKFTANPSVVPLLIRAQRLARESHDLFNPAICKLIDLWGFHDDFPPQGPPPDAAAIQALVKQHPSLRDLAINGIRIDNTNPAVKLDLGAIAKGYAVDFVIDTLKAEGIHNALINAGGDLKVLGQHGDRPWHIGIRDPRGSGVIASTDVHDGEAMFTSSDAVNYYDYHGKRYHHILDPRTGYPADKTRSVTVINHDGTLADATATALFVAGPAQWLSIAKDMGITQAMLIDSAGVIHMTPQMRQRIKLEKPAITVKVESLP